MHKVIEKEIYKCKENKAKYNNIVFRIKSSYSWKCVGRNGTKFIRKKNHLQHLEISRRKTGREEDF